jgi:hypothetical protein
MKRTVANVVCRQYGKDNTTAGKMYYYFKLVSIHRPRTVLCPRDKIRYIHWFKLRITAVNMYLELVTSYSVLGLVSCSYRNRRPSDFEMTQHFTQTNHRSWWDALIGGQSNSCSQQERLQQTTANKSNTLNLQRFDRTYSTTFIQIITALTSNTMTKARRAQKTCQYILVNS